MTDMKTYGFTILELMMTIVIAAIVLGYAVPGFQTFVRNNQTSTEVNKLIKSLNLARSEAQDRGVNVVVVPIGGNWVNGWQIGIDTDNDGTFPEAGEPVLRNVGGVDSLTFTSTPASVEYSHTGETMGLVAAFNILPNYCDNSRNRQRIVTIALAGYVNVLTDDCP